jgi:hypothetical protein
MEREPADLKQGLEDVGLKRLTGARRLIRSWAEPSYRHLSRPCLAFGLLTHTLMSQVGYPTRHRPKEAGSLTLDQEIEGSNPSRPAKTAFCRCLRG